jgi:hypothetical protein
MTRDMLGGAPAKTDPSPLSRRVAITDVPPEGLDMDIVASESERAALAALNSLPAIHSLTAALTVRRWRRDGLEATGELRARLRQTCVVTLEEFDTEIVEPIDVRFAPPAEEPRPRSRRHGPEPEPEPHEHDPLAEDPPDPLIGGAADLGAVVAEFLTLALDPYPRKPGAAFVEPAPESRANVSPFELLRRQRGEPQKGG